LTASNRKLNKKKIILTLVSVLVLLLGIVALIAGAVIMYLNTTNDSEGYALSNTYHVQTDSNAFVLWVGAPVSEARLKWIVTSTDSDKQVFAGWGAAETVNAYTSNYQYATPAAGWNYHAQAYYAALNITNVDTLNTDKPVMPKPTEIWLDTVTTSTSDSTTLSCSPNNIGDKMGMLVIMNADGSAGVDAQIQLGSRVPMYSWLPYVLISLGIVLLLVGLLLVRHIRKKPNQNSVLS
jgi:hypothetical protein